MKLRENELVDIIVNNVRKITENMDIKDKNKGKFTATQKRTGKSTEELCHSKNKKTRQRANFAKMAKRHWKPLKESEMDEIVKYAINEALKSNILRNLQNTSPDYNHYHFHGGKDLSHKLYSDAEANGIPSRNGLYTHAFLDKITDDMIDTVGTRDELRTKGYTFGSHRAMYGIGSQEVYDRDGKRRYSMIMDNGTLIVFKNDEKTISRLRQMSDESGEKWNKRQHNKYNDGAKHYQWNDEQRGMAFRDWRDTGVKFWDTNKMHPNWRKDSWVKRNADKALSKRKK